MHVMDQQPITKTIRPAVVREVISNNVVNVRLISTIYVNDNRLVRKLKIQ